MNFEDQKVMFESLCDKEVVVNYDLLIADNGKNSVVRKELEDFDKDLRVQGIHSLTSYIGVNLLTVSKDCGKLDVGLITDLMLNRF